MDNWGEFFLGALCGVASLILVAWVATEQESSLCQKQKWDGAACQCRLTLGYDKKPTD